MNPKLKENIDQIKKSIQKVNENTTGFINALDFCCDPDEKDLITLLNTTTVLNMIIMNCNECIEQSKDLLIDNIYFIDSNIEEYFKIKFNKHPNSNPDPGESQDH